jgi:mycothiol synthase
VAPPCSAAVELLTVRRPVAEDAEALAGLIRACDIAILGSSDVSVVEIRDDLTQPRFNASRDGWLGLDAGGSAVVWAWVYDPHGTDHLIADLYVHPDADQDLHRAFLTRITHRAGEMAASNAVDPAELHIGNLVTDRIRAAYLTELGFTAVRRFSRMLIDLCADEPTPTLPPRVDVRTVDPSRERDLRAFHRVLTESFREHFGAVDEPYEDWVAHLAAMADVDFGEWWLAEVDGAPAAALRGGNSLADENGGYVRELGVLPAYRRRGLGRLLLQWAFAEWGRRGRRLAGLGVDTANVTNALRLYESVGMRPAYQIDVYQIKVPAVRAVAGL